MGVLRDFQGIFQASLNLFWILRYKNEFLMTFDINLNFSKTSMNFQGFYGNFKGFSKDLLDSFCILRNKNELLLINLI